MRSSAYLNNNQRSSSGMLRNAEDRLGLPRAFRTTTNDDDGRRGGGGDYTDQETDYYDSDGDVIEEEETLLSRRYGEATVTGDDKVGKISKKRDTTDQDIAKEYAEQEKEKKKKARRNVQRTITPEDLIKPKGLTVVRNGLAPKFHSFAPNNDRASTGSKKKNDTKSQYTKTTQSMAKYSRRLVASYSNWMDDMTNGLSLQEMSWKLRSLGSKAQVKQYIAEMRNQVRDDHIERLLGLERAENLLKQLEGYYNDQGQEQEQDQDEEIEDLGPISDEEDHNHNPHQQDKDQNQTEDSASIASGVAITVQGVSGSSKVDQKVQQHELRRRLIKERNALIDSDDEEEEEEALFEDIIPATEYNNEELSATKKTSRRHVLDDSEDEDEEVDEQLDVTKKNDDDTDMLSAGNDNNNDNNDKDTIKNDDMNPYDNKQSHDSADTISEEYLKDAKITTSDNVKKAQRVLALLESCNNSEEALPEQEEEENDTNEDNSVGSSNQVNSEIKESDSGGSKYNRSEYENVN